MPYIPSLIDKLQAQQTALETQRKELARLEAEDKAQRAKEAAETAATEASRKEVDKYLKAAIKASISSGVFSDITVRYYLERQANPELALMTLCRDILLDEYLTVTKTETGYSFNGSTYSNVNALESALSEVLRVSSIPNFRAILRGHLKGAGSDLLNDELAALQRPAKATYNASLLTGADAVLLSVL